MDQSEVIDLYFAWLKETETGSATSTALLSPSAITTDFVTRARRQYVIATWGRQAHAPRTYRACTQGRVPQRPR
jgi:hypothetical protein